MENSFIYLQDFFSNPSYENAALIDQSIIQNFKDSNSIIEGGSSFFWLINYLKREPEFVSDSVKDVLGYHKTYLSKNNMGHFLKLVPEEDRKALKKVYKDIYEFYMEIPAEEKNIYRFDFNYRVQRADQRLIPVVQQIMYLQSSPTGFPLIELSIITDFSTYKTNPQVQLQIYKRENELYKKLYNFQYYEPIGGNLTVREKEIIEFISKGLTDKEIADKIYVSLHTVKTHRKHIVNKTNSRNTAEAVNKYLVNSKGKESC